jgi:hypothetical protein
LFLDQVGIQDGNKDVAQEFSKALGRIMLSLRKHSMVIEIHGENSELFLLRVVEPTIMCPWISTSCGTAFIDIDSRRAPVMFTII